MDCRKVTGVVGKLHGLQESNNGCRKVAWIAGRLQGL